METPKTKPELSAVKIEQLNKQPIVEATVQLSEDKKWVVHKTIITDIKPVSYFEKVLGSKWAFFYFFLKMIFHIFLLWIYLYILIHKRCIWTFFLWSFYSKLGFLYRFIKSEFETTLTLLNAIAIPAIIGLNKNPVKGYKSPAASGIPKLL